jgi:hypothetical protein
MDSEQGRQARRILSSERLPVPQVALDNRPGTALAYATLDSRLTAGGFNRNSVEFVRSATSP